MKRLLLLCILGMAAALPCRSQDTILLREGGETLTGRVLWDESRGDSLFYRHANGAGDSLLLFIPRRKVEYVVRADDSRMMYRGRNKGWQPWRGRTFNEVPQQRMLYGLSGGIISDGWSAEASAMRFLNRANCFGFGGFVRYTETNPFRKRVSIEYQYPTSGYSYNDRALSLGGQAELRGYLRRLKTFGYVQLGVGCSYHRFSWPSTWREDAHPESKIAFTFHCKAGLCVCLTRGLYADVAVGCMGRLIDHTMSEIASVFKTSDMYPFGVSLGLRFGRERR